MEAFQMALSYSEIRQVGEYVLFFHGKASQVAKYD